MRYNTALARFRDNPDVVIFSDSCKDHIRRVREELLQLRWSNLKVKLKKCQLGMRECIKGQVKPDLEKIRAMKEYPVPLTKKQVWEFFRRLCNCDNPID